MLPKEITEDPSIYPPAEVLKNSYWQDDVGDAIQYYENYYQYTYIYYKRLTFKCI